MENLDINAMTRQRGGAPSRPAAWDSQRASKPAKGRRSKGRQQSNLRLSGSKKKGDSVAQEFFGTTVIEEATDLEVVRDKQQKKARWMRLYIRALVFFALPLLVVVNLAYIARDIGSSEAEAVQVVEVYSPHKPIAVQEVQRFLSQQPSPMPGVRLSGWDYVEVTKDGKAALEDADLTEEQRDEAMAEAVSTETHYLTLVSETDSYYTASVEVAYSDIDGAWVTAPVSVVSSPPKADTSKTAVSRVFPQRGDVTAGSGNAFEPAVQNWAENYFSADPIRLKQSVADGRPESSYMPMPHAESVVANVKELAAARGATHNELSDAYDHVIAHISLEVTWPDVTEGHPGLVSKPDTTSGKDDDAEPEEHTAEFSYDVLIHGADTATPIVVAWGPAGTADDLEAYDNAVLHRQFDAPRED